MPRRKEPHIPDAILDQLLAGADPKTAFDPNGLLDGLKKALAERALNAEMDHHLAREETGNSRNGYGRKSVITDTGKLDLQIPRDRQASFDPQLIAKYQPRSPGFDKRVIAMPPGGRSPGASTPAPANPRQSRYSQTTRPGPAPPPRRSDKFSANCSTVTSAR